MHVQLIPLEGGDPVNLEKDLTLVGRKEDCDLRLNHKSVSKLHCVLVKSDGMLLVRDLGSTNGTRVNGQRIRRAALLPNSQLSIASFGFRVHLGEGDAPASPSQATQQMDPKEVAELLKKVNGPAKPDEDSDPDIAMPAQPNALPDVYPEDQK